MTATTHHKDVAILTGSNTTKSATLGITGTNVTGVTKLDGSAATDPTGLHCVWVRRPASGDLTLEFDVPANSTSISGTWSYGTNVGESGNMDLNNLTLFFVVTSAMEDKQVDCSMNYTDSGRNAKSVTITVRPKSSNSGVGNHV